MRKHESEVPCEEDMDSGHHQAAHRFRALNGTAKLEHTLDKAVYALYRAGIPHLVTGGMPHKSMDASGTRTT
jgi:hypothetical protein